MKSLIAGDKGNGSVILKRKLHEATAFDSLFDGNGHLRSIRRLILENIEHFTPLIWVEDRSHGCRNV